MIPADAGKISSHDMEVNSQGDVMAVTSTWLLTSLGPIPKHSFSNRWAGIMATIVSSGHSVEYTAQTAGSVLSRWQAWVRVRKKKRGGFTGVHSLQQSDET